MRDSSPPEATLASGRSGRLGMRGDLELDLLRRRAPPAPPAARSATAKRPPAIASSCIACGHRLARAPARRSCAFADSFFAAASIAPARRRHLALQRLRVWPRAPVPRGAARSSCASAGSSSGLHAVLARRPRAAPRCAPRPRAAPPDRDRRARRSRAGRAPPRPPAPRPIRSISTIGLQLRVVLRERAQPARHRGELRQAGAVGFRQRLQRRLRAREQARAVRQALVLRGERRPIRPPSGASFFSSATFSCSSARSASRCANCSSRLGRERLQPLPGAPGLGAARAPAPAAPACASSRSRCAAGAQQRLVLVLAVDVDQVLARLAQLRQRRGMAVDEAARAAGAVDRAAQEDARPDRPRARASASQSRQRRRRLERRTRPTARRAPRPRAPRAASPRPPTSSSRHRPGWTCRRRSRR